MCLQKRVFADKVKEAYKEDPEKFKKAYTTNPEKIKEVSKKAYVSNPEKLKKHLNHRPRKV